MKAALKAILSRRNIKDGSIGHDYRCHCITRYHDSEAVAVTPGFVQGAGFAGGLICSFLGADNAYGRRHRTMTRAIEKTGSFVICSPKSG